MKKFAIALFAAAICFCCVAPVNAQGRFDFPDTSDRSNLTSAESTLLDAVEVAHGDANVAVTDFSEAVNDLKADVASAKDTRDVYVDEGFGNDTESAAALSAFNSGISAVEGRINGPAGYDVYVTSLTSYTVTWEDEYGWVEDALAGYSPTANLNNAKSSYETTESDADTRWTDVTDDIDEVADLLYDLDVAYAAWLSRQC